MSKAVFLDRDGVIIQKAPEGEYIGDWSEVVILPRVAESIRALNISGYIVIIVTNQRGVARRKLTLTTLQYIHTKLVGKLAECRAAIHGVYYCPHDIAEKCQCRKPEPGMLARAGHDFSIDLRRSWMVGDSLVDVQAGQRAGCRTIFIGEGKNDILGVANEVAEDLYGAVQVILKLDSPQTVSLPASQPICI